MEQQGNKGFLLLFLFGEISLYCGMTENDRQAAALREGMEGRWILFCEEYVIDFRGKRAAIAAGYAEASASAQASALLTRPDISAYLQYLTSSRAKRLEVTADKVVQEIAKIAFHNVGDLLDYFDGNVLFKDVEDMEFPELIKSIEIKEVKNSKGNRVGQVAKIVLHDKLKALEMLGKYTAIFTETIDHKNNGGSFAPPQTTNVFINHRPKGAPLAPPEVLEIEAVEVIELDELAQ